MNGLCFFSTFVSALNAAAVAHNVATSGPVWWLTANTFFAVCCGLTAVCVPGRAAS